MSVVRQSMEINLTGHIVILDEGKRIEPLEIWISMVTLLYSTQYRGYSAGSRISRDNWIRHESYANGALSDTEKSYYIHCRRSSQIAVCKYNATQVAKKQTFLKSASASRYNIEDHHKWICIVQQTKELWRIYSYVSIRLTTYVFDYLTRCGIRWSSAQFLHELDEKGKITALTFQDLKDAYGRVKEYSDRLKRDAESRKREAAEEEKFAVDDEFNSGKQWKRYVLSNKSLRLFEGKESVYTFLCVSLNNTLYIFQGYFLFSIYFSIQSVDMQKIIK